MQQAEVGDRRDLKTMSDGRCSFPCFGHVILTRMTDESPSTGRSGRGQARCDVRKTSKRGKEREREWSPDGKLGRGVVESRAEEQLSVYSN